MCLAPVWLLLQAVLPSVAAAASARVLLLCGCSCRLCCLHVLLLTLHVSPVGLLVYLGIDVLLALHVSPREAAVGWMDLCIVLLDLHVSPR
jgi:hypothetical protein